MVAHCNDNKKEGTTVVRKEITVSKVSLAGFFPVR
jgi:hypothetical protein